MEIQTRKKEEAREQELKINEAKEEKYISIDDILKEVEERTVETAIIPGMFIYRFADKTDIIVDIENDIIEIQNCDIQKEIRPVSTKKDYMLLEKSIVKVLSTYFV